MLPDSSRKGVTVDPIPRRTALQLLGIGGVGLAAAACTDTSGSSGGSTDQPKNAKFSFPDTGAKLPSGDVKLRWVDSGDRKAVFFNAFFPAYQSKHSNVSVDYQGNNWNTIQQVISTGVRNGTAPDVFQLPPQITFAQAVTNKWIGAYDDIV
ncbi:MAG TPA: extracellular solute-binding protein, partial [Mycobacteriales bacterium]|nr:extracellular solute-binding protein [Mycobacteriales bacterium]